MKASTNGRGAGQALHLLHRAGQCADEIFAESMGESNLTPRQFAVLKAAAETKGPSQTVLVEETGIDRSTLADIVRRLLERGLVARERAKHDARAYVVRVTAQGQAVIKRAEPAARRVDDRLLSSLLPGERASFLKALSQIVERQTD